MSYSTNDTDWDISSTGKWWRRLNGVVLVVGKTYSRYYGDSYWICIEGELQKGMNIPKLADAQKRAEWLGRAVGVLPLGLIDLDEELGMPPPDTTRNRKK